MRPNILTLLLAFFTVTIATAQLYDNRARYLRTPHDVDKFERTIYEQRKPIKSTYRSTPTRSSSYSNYRSRISKYARPSYDSREFYYNFRDPSVLNRYANNAVKSEFDLTDCHCNIRFDVDQAFRQWYRNQQLVREALLRGYETLFEKKIENLLNKQFPDFKSAQKEFFKEYGKINHSDYIKEISNITSYDLYQHQLEFGKAKSYYKFFDYVKTQNDIYSRQPVNIRRVDLVGDLVINGQLVRRPSRWRGGPSRLMYNTSNLNALFNDMKNSYREFLISKKIYDGLNGNFSFFYDYLSEKYVEHYNSQSNYEYKLGAFNGYIEHYQNQTGYGTVLMPTHNYSSYMLFKVPTNGNELRAFFKKNLAKNIDYTYRGSLPTIETAIANVALYELDEFTLRELSEISYNGLKDKDRKKRLYGKIKEAVLNKSVLRNAVKQYFKNAIPIYDYSIQSVKDAVGSRLENKPFMWSELDIMPYFKFQNAAKPEVLFTLDLKVRLERKRQRFPAPEFYRYKGIADVLKYIYNVEKYWGVEGATIRHFLKEKGLTVPSSLSNRDLGTLFDFGGGNTNTLTIEFSDYAKKYITNFHHGDGIYGTSLFTDPFKLQALKEILKGNRVDFDKFSLNDLWDNQGPYDDWNRLTQCEKDFFKRNPQHLYTARGNKSEAEKSSWNRFNNCKTPNGTPMHNTIGDAYRHAYFAALNTHNMGYSNAKALGDAHECDVPSNKLNEKQMDLHNNAWGYHYGSTVSYINEEQFYTSFMDAFNRGQIKILQKCQ